MTRYRYRAHDPEGRAANGEMEEQSAHRVKLRLEERGLTVTQVEEAFKDRGLVRISTQLTADELHLFTQQLLAVTQSGLPLPPALRALAADLRSPRLKAALDTLHRDLGQGNALSEALERQRNRFPALFVALIRAGEAAGNLPGMLQLLTAYTARQLAFRAMLQTAMVYPIVVFAAACGVLAFLLVKVVPVFADIFTEFGGQLPAPTRFWIGISELLWDHGRALAVAAAAVAAAIGLARWRLGRSAGGRAMLDAVRMRIPWYGYSYYLVSVARFARALAMLLASRVPVLDAFELAAAASGSALLARHVEEAAQQVAAGARMADALAGTRFFGHSFCWLLGAGEDRGEADSTLDSLADTAERQAQGRDRSMGSMLGPALVVAVGLLVASIIISLYLPIFTLGDQISGT